MTCSNCGQPIEKGQPMAVAPGSRAVLCKRCLNKGSSFRETVSLNDAPKPGTPLKERELRG